MCKAKHVHQLANFIPKDVKLCFAFARVSEFTILNYISETWVHYIVEKKPFQEM
jgi:hypothetical protein